MPFKSFNIFLNLIQTFHCLFCPMASFDSKFFLNLEVETSEEEMDSSIQTVFQNEMSLLTKDNSNYVKKLKEQIEKVDALKKKNTK